MPLLKPTNIVGKGEIFISSTGKKYPAWSHDAVGKNGKKVGTLRPNGYKQIYLKGKTYLIHRIIFLMHYGYLPKCIDHIDGNPLNNKIENLRAVTLSQNQYNRKIAKHNTSGIKGVYWHKRSQKWMARCNLDKKCFYLGSYKNLDDAKDAVMNFRKIKHGEFARNT